MLGILPDINMQLIAILLLLAYNRFSSSVTEDTLFYRGKSLSDGSLNLRCSNKKIHTIASRCKSSYSCRYQFIAKGGLAYIKQGIGVHSGYEGKDEMERTTVSAFSPIFTVGLGYNFGNASALSLEYSKTFGTDNDNMYRALTDSKNLDGMFDNVHSTSYISLNYS